MARTRSTSPGRAPNVRRLTAWITCSSALSSRDDDVTGTSCDAAAGEAQLAVPSALAATRARRLLETNRDRMGERRRVTWFTLLRGERPARSIGRRPGNDCR